jgi:hypothetical protein
MPQNKEGTKRSKEVAKVVAKEGKLELETLGHIERQYRKLQNKICKGSMKTTSYDFLQNS